jgi:hypothetical protein
MPYVEAKLVLLSHALSFRTIWPLLQLDRHNTPATIPTRESNLGRSLQARSKPDVSQCCKEERNISLRGGQVRLPLKDKQVLFALD